MLLLELGLVSRDKDRHNSYLHNGNLCLEQKSNYYDYDILIWLESDSWLKSPGFVG